MSRSVDAESKSGSTSTYGQYKADGTAYEQSDSFFSIIAPILAPKGETIEVIDEDGNTLTRINSWTSYTQRQTASALKNPPAPLRPAP